VLTKDHTVLPATHTYIHKWNPRAKGVWGSAVSSPSRVRGGSPATKRFLLYFKCSGWLLLYSWQWIFFLGRLWGFWVFRLTKQTVKCYACNVYNYAIFRSVSLQQLLPLCGWRRNRPTYFSIRIFCFTVAHRACLDQLVIAIRSFTLLCDHSRSKKRLIAITNLIAKLGIIYATARHASLCTTAWLSDVTAAAQRLLLLYKHGTGAGEMGIRESVTAAAGDLGLCKCCDGWH